MSDYTIKGERLTGIADAVRGKRELQGMTPGKPLAPAEIQAEIDRIRLGLPVKVTMHTDEDGVWHRPEGWPDLDALWASEPIEEGAYLTYDNTERDCSFGLQCDLKSVGTYTINVGYVDADGGFVSVQQYELNDNASCVQNVGADIDRDYVVIKVVADNDNGIVKFSYCPIETSISGKAIRITSYGNRCLERIGKLSNITSFGTNANGSYGCYYLERDGIDFSASEVTTLAYTWQYCYSLQSLDLSGWDTSSWAVTTLQYTWQNCYSLQSLDLSGWDTSGWAVTTLGSTWNACYSLQSLDLSGWDTSSWAVNTLQYTWNACYSLQSLDLSGWDTSSWAVNTLQYTWNGCYSLQSLDLSGWDTSGWAVTTLGSTWNACYSLQSLDISGWDTNGWSISNISNALANLNALRHYKHAPLKTSFTLNTSRLLDPSDIVGIMQALPETATPLTVTLGDLRMMLTDDDIAIATGKGWTVA